MGITVRDFDTMVDAVLQNIVDSNVGITDISRGSVVRAIVEAILSELDMEYFQIENVYNALLIDEAQSDDLDRLISILGVTRNPATPAVGTVRFGRSTAATQDIPIPMGTIVSTRLDNNGDTIEFATTEYGQMYVGDTYVDVPVEAVVPGHIAVSIGQLSRMNTPIMGVDTVGNQAVIDSGSDAETDDLLRSRAKLALSGLGKATDDALTSAVMSVDGVVEVLVLDQNRGVGTVDISVACSSSPIPQTVMDNIQQAIANNKAAGIDVQVIYPTIKYIDISVSVTYDDGYAWESVKNSCGNAIMQYTSGLGLGAVFVLSQMQRAVLNSTNAVLDISTIAPTSNVTATVSEIIRASSITINGEVWS